MKYLWPRRKVLMRSRVAILIAAAVVFAPGWHRQAAPRHVEGSALVARVLAPTVDEGTLQEAATNVKHQLGVRQLKRWDPSLTSVGTFGASVAATALVVLWIIATHRGRLNFVYRFSKRLSRAPPRLQPA
jgi:hypothetical protein